MLTPPPPTLVYIMVNWLNSVPAMCLHHVRLAAFFHSEAVEQRKVKGSGSFLRRKMGDGKNDLTLILNFDKHLDVNNTCNGS